MSDWKYYLGCVWTFSCRDTGMRSKVTRALARKLILEFDRSTEKSQFSGLSCHYRTYI